MEKNGVVDQRVQDYFVLLAISDDRFVRAARHSIKPAYFGSQVTQEIVQICYNFFDQFATSPGKHFKDEMIRFLEGRNKDDIDLTMTYLERIQELDLPNRAYIISRINRFCQAREMEKGAVDIARLAKDGDFEKAREVMQKVLRSGIANEEVGLKYFKEDFPGYLMPHSSSEKLINLGMPPIDKRFPRGLCRTDFLCLLGGYKGKKSWACIYLGMLGLLRGLKVLHISHELSLNDTAIRYDMMHGSLSGELEKLKDNVCIENPGEDGSLGKMETVEVPTVANSDLVINSVRRKIGRLGGGLIIQKYDMGSCTMGEIIRYLDYLESFEGFVPDILLNDYVEKMKIPAGEGRRDLINDMYMEMKGIADERKLLSVTVSQTTREALRKHKLDQKDFAEDIRKLGNADIVLALSQTDEMAEMNRMLMWVLANRHGAMDFGCKFSMNLEIGQFCLGSWEYNSSAKKRSRGEEDDRES